MRTRVKICGFTRVEDAVCAARAGADAIGLVFYPPSPRHVEIEQAAAIAAALPAFASVVALFVDAPETYIRDVLAKVAVDCIQFHGGEPARACGIYGKRYIKAVAMRDGVDIAALAEKYRDAGGLLLDAYHPDAKGGTGSTFDWDRIPKHCALPIILAGGLDAGNIQSAITTVKPYAVDVSSGVELNKGIKDPQKIAAFMNAVDLGDRRR